MRETAADVRRVCHFVKRRRAHSSSDTSGLSFKALQLFERRFCFHRKQVCVQSLPAVHVVRQYIRQHGQLQYRLDNSHLCRGDHLRDIRSRTSDGRARHKG